MTDDTQSAAERERRRNLALRKLVDEMLGKVRDASNRAAASTWAPGERERAELELAEIMARVREEALQREGARLDVVDESDEDDIVGRPAGA